MFDEQGNVNNVIEVQDYVPENLDGLSGFEPPPSPPSSYTCPAPVAEDYAKEPPIMPPQLQLTLLNVTPMIHDTQSALPRPQHVVLGHVYCHASSRVGNGSGQMFQQQQSNVNALVIGMTHRYKSKYVTSVLYKPKKKPGGAAEHGL